MPNTIVTGQLTDNYGLVWSNAKIQISFQPNPDQPGPYCFDGDCGTTWQNISNGNTDGAGNFTASLPDNNDIAPAGSMWRFAISPNADAPSVILVLPISGPTQDISSQFRTAVTLYITQSLAVPRSYAVFTTTSEPPDDGQLIFDTTNQQFYYWTAGNWNLLVASAPPATGFVQFLPPGAQTITQPPNTNFTINTSGSGLTQIGGPFSVGTGPSFIHFDAAGNGSFGGNLFANAIQTPNATIDTNGNVVINNSLTIGSGASFTHVDSHGNASFGGNLFANAIQTPHTDINADGSMTIGTGASFIHFDNNGDGSFGGNLFCNALQTPHTQIVADGSVTIGDGGTFTHFDSSGNASVGGNFFAGGSADLGALKIGGAAPNAFILVGNGTSYAPQPLSNFINAVVVQDFSGGGRVFNTVNHNPSATGYMIVSGYGRTNGGTTGSMVGLIGASSAPATKAWGQTNGATVNNGAIAFSFVVPPLWFYNVVANTLANPGDTGVTGVGSWVETTIG